MWRPCSKVGKCGHTLSAVLGGACVQTEASKDVPERTQSQSNVKEADRVDFDEALLTEDSYEGDLDDNYGEVIKIMDVR